MMKRFISVVFVFLLIFVLAACGSQQSQQGSKQKASGQSHSTAKKQKQAFPVTITDATGKKVTIKKKPKRIVSLIPSNTEITYALGAGNRVVGDSKFDDYPKAATKVTKIGGVNFNVEKIISLKPDLVLAYGTQMKSKSGALNQLRKAGIPVVVVNQSSNFNDVYKSIDMIARATGTTSKASQIISHMKSKIAAIKKKASTIPKKDRVKVWVEISAPPNLYTAGSGTFMGQMLNIINAKNIAANVKGWPKYSAEKVVKQNPDAIVLTYGLYTKNAVKKVLNRPGWQNVAAVKNKRVYSINSDLVSRPGPRLVKGVEQLAHAIYPKVFKK